jgi:hypothetical protein
MGFRQSQAWVKVLGIASLSTRLTAWPASVQGIAYRFDELGNVDFAERVCIGRTRAHG